MAGSNGLVNLEQDLATLMVNLTPICSLLRVAQLRLKGQADLGGPLGELHVLLVHGLRDDVSQLLRPRFAASMVNDGS